MSKQAAIQDEILDLNKEVGALEMREALKNNENTEQDKQFQNDRVRILQNTFSRLSDIDKTVGFDAIRDYVRLQKHKEKVIKRTIYHWRRHNAFILMSVMKQWAAKERMRDKVDIGKQLDKEMEDMS